jgi:hypothetical protein
MAESGKLRAHLRAGWRMASTAMRLAILAAREDTFYVLIGGPHFGPPLS